VLGAPLQIKRARNLRTTAGSSGPFYAYVVARFGEVHHRTHVEDASSNPEWNEVVMFDARSMEQEGSVVTFEVWNQGYLTDDLVGGIDIGIETRPSTAGDAAAAGLGFQPPAMTSCRDA
jgi:Ca2+-dependent lipid-binding protein